MRSGGRDIHNGAAPHDNGAAAGGWCRKPRRSVGSWKSARACRMATKRIQCVLAKLPGLGFPAQSASGLARLLFLTAGDIGVCAEAHPARLCQLVAER